MPTTRRLCYPPAMRTVHVGLALLAFVACSGGGTGEGAGNAANTSGKTFSLPFVPDDYAGALVQARERDIPIFVETWAPW